MDSQARFPVTDAVRAIAHLTGQIDAIQCMGAQIPVGILLRMQLTTHDLQRIINRAIEAVREPPSHAPSLQDASPV